MLQTTPSQISTRRAIAPGRDCYACSCVLIFAFGNYITRGFQMYYLDTNMLRHEAMALYRAKRERSESGFRLELPRDIGERFPKYFAEMSNERWVVAPGESKGKWRRTGEQASFDCFVYALAGAFKGIGGIEGRQTWDAARWATRRAELGETPPEGKMSPPPPTFSGFAPRAGFCGGLTAARRRAIEDYFAPRRSGALREFVRGLEAGTIPAAPPE